MVANLARLVHVTLLTPFVAPSIPYDGQHDRFSGGAAARGRAPAGEGRLFFLLTARGDLPLGGIWQDFFSSGNQTSQSHAFLHCTDARSCEKSMEVPRIFKLVPTVKSTYCYDLVSPMLATLQAALSESADAASPWDRFIFVSESSVPVKSLGEMQRLARMLGDVSVFALMEAEPGEPSRLRASQWSVLSRSHAERMMATYNSDGLRGPFWDKLSNATGERTTDQCCCLDEYWPLSAVFSPHDSREDPPMGLMNSNLTFTHWGDGYGASLGPDHAITLQARDTESGPLGPGIFYGLSKDQLRRFKASTYWFMRKVNATTFFDGTIGLRHAFRRYVFDA